MLITKVLLVIALAGLSDGDMSKRSTTTSDGSQTHWTTRGRNDLKRAMELEGKLIKNKAKNIILVVGDGMGVSTVTAARWYKSELYKTPIASTTLSWEELPHFSHSKTHNADARVPDSAGTASAMMSGEKAQEGVIGYDHTVVRQTCQPDSKHKVKTVMEYAMEQGKSTGVVTTTPITHATPAATYAHISERFWNVDSLILEECNGRTKDIALQLVEDNPNINVLFAGGRNDMLPNTTADPIEKHLKGLRTDGRNLIEEWVKHKKNKNLDVRKYKTVFDQQDFDNLDTEEVDYVFGLMRHSHLAYNVSRLEKTPGQPSLPQLTAKALKILQKNKDGYFLMVEEGQIDWAHHYNRAKEAVDNTAGMDETVRVIMDMTDPEDTLLIVTADHSHTMVIAGHTKYNTTGLFEFDERMTGLDGKPYLALMYATGPGYSVHRRDENGTEIPRKDINDFGDHINDLYFVNDAAVDAAYATHAGEDVSIYSRGPWSHLFHATHDQTYIGHVMLYAGCISDPQADHCTGKKPPAEKPCGASTASLAYTCLLLILARLVG